jgi:hypothetical protein
VNVNDTAKLATELTKDSSWCKFLEMPLFSDLANWVESPTAREFYQNCRWALQDNAVKMICFSPFWRDARKYFDNQDSSFLRAGGRNIELSEIEKDFDSIKIQLTRQFGWAERSAMYPIIEDAAALGVLFNGIVGSVPTFPSISILSGDHIDPLAGLIHADVTTLTMVCTFFGRCTEVTEPDNVRGFRYDKLERWPHYQKNFDLVSELNFKPLGVGMVAIFKGERSRADPREFVRQSQQAPFNPDGGLVHRAPLLLPGEMRVYFQTYCNAIPLFLQGT